MKCKDCKWWEDAEKANSPENNFYGFCRRYPPSIVSGMILPDGSKEEMDYDDVIMGIFPIVMIKDWCGEFKDKQTVPSPGSHA